MTWWRPVPVWLVGAIAAAACEDPPAADTLPPLCAPRGEAVGWFVERAAETGLVFDYRPLDYRGGAVAVADLDGDGRLDVLAGSRVGGLAAFQNLGGLRFEEVGRDLGLATAGGIRFVAPADLDGDGDVDLAIATDAGLVLLERLATGFEARDFPATSQAIEHVLPADLDDDGDLDLFAASREYAADPDGRRVFLNRGGLAFEAWDSDDVASAGMAWTSSAFDHDGDGDLDVHVANDTFEADHGTGDPVPESRLPPDAFYQNQLAELGALGLLDRAAAEGLATPRSSMGGLWGDLDGRPGLELFVTDFGAKKVFVAGPDGFVDRADELGLAAARRDDGSCAGDLTSDACLLLSWGSQIGDFDLDGHDDLIVANGVSVPNGEPPPQLAFRGPPPYREVDAGLGCFEGHGLVAADLDDDGDLDVLASTRSGPLRLFENQAEPGDRWLAFVLAGAGANRQGLGAVVEVVLADGRRLVRVVGSGGVVHASPPPRVHVGLGAAAVERVMVRWPSGAVQELTSVTVGRRGLIVEP
jgi:enediyne biosynthesis protein E4